jgi:hypothetical protein
MNINMEKFYNAFNYPFGFINYGRSDYNIENFTVAMFDNNLKSENIDIKSINFPNDIIDVYWYEKGKNDYKPWEFVGKLKYKDSYYYVYYIANCDYTGFDCQGDMKMYISEYLSRILNNAIPHNKLHNYEKIKNILEN